MDKYSVLKQYFGYTSFREGQEPLIDHILAGQDTLGIMPTGAGKSICFQVPALLMEGITIVISPLVSLMKDQVTALVQNGIPAAFFNSSLTSAQYRKALENAKMGQYKIIYVAPERLIQPGFLEFVHHIKISFLTVDEAHCISQWGQDFRPSYLQIPAFIAALPQRPVVAAFTATATKQVRADIMQQLALQEPFSLTTGFDRPNLFFGVHKPTDKLTFITDYLKKNKEKSGVIYCLTRKTVESLCQNLCENGYEATRYHAGLSDLERKTNQEEFIFDRKKIMVATNAFGMGIDKSNVSYVIHYNMPKNLESYYQEAGRAGRDGTEAQCILLFSEQDVRTNQFFIDQIGVNPNGEESLLDAVTLEELKKKERSLLRAMTLYCKTDTCLREYMMHYFDEEAPSNCSNCSNCNSNFIDRDITEETQKIMSCVVRLRENFGINLVIDTLHGSKKKRILDLGLPQCSTYGIMADVPIKQIRAIIDHLILNGYLLTTNSEYPVLRLTAKGRQFLQQPQPLQMRMLEPDLAALSVNDSMLGKKVAARKITSAQDFVAELLFEKLRALRRTLADQQQVPAFVVFSDATLRAMATMTPTTKSQLLEVPGVGQAKLNQYGDAFLTVIKNYVEV